MKYVFTDLDGTLLTKDGLKQYSIDVLRSYQSKGNKLILASGRNYKSVEGFVESLKLKEYKGALILVNGSIFIDYEDGEFKEGKTLNKEDVKRIIRLADLLMLRIYIVTKQGRFTYRVLYDRLFYLARLIIKHKPMPKLEAIKLKDLPDEIQKVELCPTIFFHFFSNLYMFIFKHLNKDYEVMKINKLWMEIMPKGISKGKQVEYYLNKYHIDRDHVYIFGDGENDISMLSLTTHSYCPKNSSDEVKKIVKNVCEDNESQAIARIIKTL